MNSIYPTNLPGFVYYHDPTKLNYKKSSMEYKDRKNHGDFDAGTKVINTNLSGDRYYCSLSTSGSTTGSYAYLTNSSADPSVAAEYNTSMTNSLVTDYKLGQYKDNKKSYKYN